MTLSSDLTLVPHTENKISNVMTSNSDFLIHVSTQRKENWYKNICALNLLSMELPCRMEQFEKLSYFFKGYKAQPEQAYCISEILYKIFKNQGASKEFKEQIFNKTSPNLLEFTKIQEIKDDKVSEKSETDPFWRVRYAAIQNLYSIMDIESNYANLIKDEFISLFSKEGNPYVGNLLFKIFQEKSMKELLNEHLIHRGKSNKKKQTIEISLSKSC